MIRTSWFWLTAANRNAQVTHPFVRLNLPWRRFDQMTAVADYAWRMSTKSSP